MSVRLSLPGALRPLVGGGKTVELNCPAGSLAEVLDAVAADYPALGRRIRDEQGALRRYVNVYVDGQDVRAIGGAQAVVGEGAEVLVLPSVAGG
jgi:sulfur-carrier protein